MWWNFFLATPGCRPKSNVRTTKHYHALGGFFPVFFLMEFVFKTNQDMATNMRCDHEKTWLPGMLGRTMHCLT